MTLRNPLALLLSWERDSLEQDLPPSICVLFRESLSTGQKKGAEDSFACAGGREIAQKSRVPDTVTSSCSVVS